MVAFVTHVIEPARAPPHSGPEMSPAASTTQGMQQNPPPSLAGPDSDIPARPAVVPMLPTRRPQPGRQAPLPDPVAVRRRAVPDPAPPFDDETGVTSEDLHTGNEVTSATAAAESAAAAPPGPEPPGPDAPDEPGPGRRPGGPAGHTARSGPGDGWPSQFAQVLAETLAGSRPATQLAPWTTEQARRRIRQLGPMLATDQRPKVRRVMTSAAGRQRGRDDGRSRDSARGSGCSPLRLEREQAGPRRPAGRRWCCTAIESA